MSVDFRFRFGFYMCSLRPAFICCSLLFFVLFAAVPACFDMDPHAIYVWYTHIGFYVLSYNKKNYFFYYFYVFASFFLSINAHFMSTVWLLCRIFAFELYFWWYMRKKQQQMSYIRYEPTFCNLICCLLLNFNRTNETFRQFAEQT